MYKGLVCTFMIFQFVDNTVYNFTMSWSTGVKGGSETLQLQKDTDLDAALSIYVQDIVDLSADDKIRLKAEFTTCLALVGIYFFAKI